MKISIFWFRRDLRLHDNAGLYHALKGEHPVLPLFIFDRYILDELPAKDSRVAFIHGVLQEMKTQLEEKGSSMEVRYGKPIEIWKALIEEYEIAAVYTNRDYEPYAKTRDGNVEKLLAEKSIDFHTFKDHVLFEREEVVKKDGDPYTVFTPYSKVWKKKMESEMEQDENGNVISDYFKSYPSEEHDDNFYESQPKEIPSLEEMGFEATEIAIPDKSVKQKIIKNYDETRNFPAINGTSRLGIHFRFGTISIREKARKARALNATFLNELIWRDFYSMILYHYPKVVDQAFREKYDRIPWRNDKADFEKWCIGKTGYPIVDAGMRELNATGYMHNRVRMITASFLTKHLLIDWRWGEAYFAEKLLDYDLASNNGGWQWAAGSGTDAAPYFRIFNPTSQQQKFDKDFKYIKKWVSEYGTDDYPEPMVDHKAARERCLKTYKEALG
ncbi:MAG: deoxyribodipyrimidine photo-lyase [Bacteroidota bacterium]